LTIYRAAIYIEMRHACQARRRSRRLHASDGRTAGSYGRDAPPRPPTARVFGCRPVMCGGADPGPYSARQGRSVRHRLPPGSYDVVPIAETGGRFVDFAPYVPAINDRGVVAFQATASRPTRRPVVRPSTSSGPEPELRRRLRAHHGARVRQVVLHGRVRQAEAVGGLLGAGGEHGCTLARLPPLGQMLRHHDGDDVREPRRSRCGKYGTPLSPGNTPCVHSWHAPESAARGAR
jgi:hypothetical protein